MAENDGNDRGPVSRGGIAPQPLFAVAAVLLGSFLANFDSRLTTVGPTTSTRLCWLSCVPVNQDPAVVL